MILYKTTFFGNKIETVGLEVSESKNSYMITDERHLSKRVKKDELLVPDSSPIKDRSVICTIFHHKEDSEKAVELARAEIIRKLTKNRDSARYRLKMAEETLEAFNAGSLR